MRRGRLVSWTEGRKDGWEGGRKDRREGRKKSFYLLWFLSVLR